MSWRSPSPEHTLALARGLGEVAESGGVIALVGPLGAGKTVFAKGAAAGLGIDPDHVASPTFVIANELHTPKGRRIVHADFYRVEKSSELEAAGLHDWLAPGTLLVAEWGDRFPEVLPLDRLEVHIEPQGQEVRQIHARAGGEAAMGLLARWRARCP